MYEVTRLAEDLDKVEIEREQLETNRKDFFDEKNRLILVKFSNMKIKAFSPQLK